MARQEDSTITFWQIARAIVWELRTVRGLENQVTALTAKLEIALHAAQHDR